jgi:hypothetical protein
MVERLVVIDEFDDLLSFLCKYIEEHASSLRELAEGYGASAPPFAIAIQGDDSFGIHCDFLSYYVDLIAVDLVALLGFKLKFNFVTSDMFSLDYCSRNFYYIDSYPGFILAPKPFKVLNKIAWSTKPKQDLLVHNRGVALGLYNDSRVVPFLREYVDRILELTSEVEVDPMNNPFAIHLHDEYDMDSRNYDLMYQRYGLTESDVLSFESSLKEAWTFPFYVGAHFTRSHIQTDS